MTNTPAHWRTEIERLEGQLQKAEQALDDAKGRAATAILEGSNDESRVIALARDRIDATKAAIGEAQRRLADAEQAVTAKTKKAALKKAKDAARLRYEAAQEFDEALRAAEAALVAFLGTGTVYRQQMADAGFNEPPRHIVVPNEALKGATLELAPTLAKITQVPRAGRNQRQPLASMALASAPWKDAK